MNCNEKVMLASGIEREFSLNDLCRRLEAVTHIPFTTRMYLNYYLLIANNEFDYRMGLVTANLLAASMFDDVKWLDIDNNMKEVNKICICKLHINRNTDSVGDIIEKFSEKLARKIETSVSVKYIYSKQIYELYIKLTDIFPGLHARNIYSKDYGKILYTCNELLAKIKSFVDSYMLSKDYTSNSDVFDQIELFDFYGSLITDAYIKQEETVNLINYFRESSLILGIKYPEGYNLSPKEAEEIDYVNEKYWVNNTRYHLEYIGDSIYERLDTGIEGSRSFSTYFGEEYSLLKSKDYITLRPPKFEMNDVLSVSYKIEILSESKLVVKSDVKVNRKVKGEKLCSSPTVYDALYKNKDYVDGGFTFTVTDYYEIIGLNKLLHYTDASKFYETFEIPFGFRFENGLSDVENTRTIYDDTNKENWICYEDISEVKKALLENAK